MLVVRYGELAIKSSFVRTRMENLLIRNIRECMKRKGITGKIHKKRGRIIIDSEDFEDLSRVFGIVSYSKAIFVKKDIGKIKEEALKQYKKSKGTFRVSSQRLDKDFPLTSQELSRDVGAYIVEKTGAKVKLKEYDINIRIEILKDEAYVFSAEVRGPGGLPLGSAGRMILLGSVESGIEIMKRGVIIDCDNESKRKELSNWDYGVSVKKINEKKNYDGVIIDFTVDKNKIMELKEKYKLPVYAPLIG